MRSDRKPAPRLPTGGAGRDRRRGIESPTTAESGARRPGRSLGAGLVDAAAPLLGLALLRFDWPRVDWLESLRGQDVLHAQRAVEARDLLVLAALKTLFHVVFVGVFYWGPRAFGVEPPLVLVLAATPIILAAGALPITPAGLGTQQTALLFFFLPASPGVEGGGAAAAILAFGLGFPLVTMATRGLLGLYYLGHPFAALHANRSPS